MSLLFAFFGPVVATVLDPRARILKHPLRKRILEIVERQPGILPQALAQAMDCNRSTVRYHLAVMQGAGIVRIVSRQQRAHLFAATLSVQSQHALAVLQRGRTWELARQVAQNPGQPQRELTMRLQMSRKILRKYVDRLLQLGLIQEIPDSPYLTYFPTVDLTKMVATYSSETSTTFREEPAMALDERHQEGHRPGAQPVTPPGIEVPR